MKAQQQQIKERLVMIPLEEWEELRIAQSEILRHIKQNTQGDATGITITHITAKDFMDAIRIKRTKFDQLVQINKIKTIKKDLKIYVPVSEIEQYFNDKFVH